MNKFQIKEKTEMKSIPFSVCIFPDAPTGIPLWKSRRLTSIPKSLLQLQSANKWRKETSKEENITIIMNLTEVTRNNTASWIMEASGNVTTFIQLQEKAIPDSCVGD